MTVRVLSMDQPAIEACPMPDRFRHDVTYFATPAGMQDAPQQLGEREYWIRSADARQILDDGVVTIVSPLDSSYRTEIEISEEHERFLEWLLRNEVQHVRLD